MKYMDIAPRTRKDELDFLMAQRKPQTKIHVVSDLEPVLSVSSFERAIDAIHSIQGLTEPYSAFGCVWYGLGVRHSDQCRCDEDEKQDV